MRLSFITRGSAPFLVLDQTGRNPVAFPPFQPVLNGRPDPHACVGGRRGPCLGRRDRWRSPELELSGAEIIVQALIDEGVEYVFGYPGGAVLHTYDALFKQDKV